MSLGDGITFAWDEWMQTLTFHCQDCDIPLRWDDGWLICEQCGVEDPPHCLACTDAPRACPDCGGA